MPEVLLFGLGIPAIVTVIVQVAKALNLATDNTAPWWAFISGVLLSYLATLVTQFPQIIPFVQPLIYAIMIYGASTGIYHGLKQIGTHIGLVDKKSVDIVDPSVPPSKQIPPPPTDPNIPTNLLGTSP